MSARVRGQRNSVLAINKLPNELLTTILQDVIPRGFEYYQNLREIALVSRRWADILWNCPSFWTVVLCDDPRASTALALQKSQGLPLDVNVLCREVESVYPNLHHNHHTFTDLVDPEHSRWRSVTLDMDSLNGVEKYTGTLAANVRELDVRVKDERGWTDTPFESATSPLEVLSLSGCRFLWTRLQVPKLRSLTVDRLNANRTFRMNELVQLISNCPRLETLEITNSELYCETTDPSGQHYEHEHPEHLVPSLKTLRIENNYNAHHIACRLITPNCTSYTVKVAFGEGYDWRVAQYLGPWMARITSDIPSDRFQIGLGRDTFALRFNDAWMKIVVEIPTIMVKKTPGYMAILEAMGQPLRRKLTHLTMTSSTHEDSNKLSSAFARVSSLCPSITTVSLQAYFANNITFMELLSKRYTRMGWFFPLMDRIELHIQRLEAGGNALLNLVRASNGQQPDRRPTRLVHAHLRDGWIHDDTAGEIARLGVTITGEDVQASKVSQASVEHFHLTKSS